ncbi:MAG: hypothetical protein JRI22_03875 [Deltaproteobacteria bacterium]|nr:hypothetical protein [Deltaproteobacteria bacterium]
MEQIGIFLETVKLARKQTCLNMALFPLLAPNGDEPEYLTLEEALDNDAIEITEVTKGGSVQELKLINRGAQHVLIVEGEELVGAKQNRIVNATFLFAGNSEVIIPVSCVEQGRWDYRSHKFESGGKLMQSSLRGEHKSAVMASLASGGGFQSDQDMIWNGLAQKAHRMNVCAPTMAMADLFEQHEDRFSSYLKSFFLVDNQVGAVFVLNGKVAGLECFGYQRTFAGFFEKLIKSYVLDALDWLQEGQTIKPRTEPVRRFLDATKNAKRETYPSIGLGKNISMHSRTISGSALVNGEKVLHLSAFRIRNQSKGGKVPFHRYSARRRQRQSIKID